MAEVASEISNTSYNFLFLSSCASQTYVEPLKPVYQTIDLSGEDLTIEGLVLSCDIDDTTVHTIFLGDGQAHHILGKGVSINFLIYEAIEETEERIHLGYPTGSCNEEITGSKDWEFIVGRISGDVLFSQKTSWVKLLVREDGKVSHSQNGICRTHETKLFDGNCRAIPVPEKSIKEFLARLKS